MKLYSYQQFLMGLLRADEKDYLPQADQVKIFVLNVGNETLRTSL